MTLLTNAKQQAEAPKKTWLTPELELISRDEILSAIRSALPESITGPSGSTGNVS